MEPLWLREARKHIGQKEVPGMKSNPWIVGLRARFKSWLTGDDSSVPWCGLFCDYCMTAGGVVPPKNSFRAKAWLDWGTTIANPVVGAVVIFGREGGGHVGFVAGKDEAGNLMVLGGNQGDAVKISPFAMSGPNCRIVGFRIPKDWNLPYESMALPRLASDGKLSTNEA